MALRTIIAMLEHPAYMDMLASGMAAFSDSDGSLLIAAPGELERREMADLVYMLLASHLGHDDLDTRLTDASESLSAGPLEELALRVEWRSMTQHGQELTLDSPGQGDPVTVISLAGLVSIH